MKRIMAIFFMVVSATLNLKAQSADYQQQMETLLVKLDKAKAAGHFQALANDFIRIANAEKTQWLPFYYAAFCNVRVAYQYRETPEKIEPFSKLAESQIEKAKTLAPKDASAQSEIKVVESMVNRTRIFMSPMQNGPKYGPVAGRLVEEAKKLDVNNPRVLYTEAFTKYYTPRMWGGDKDEAKELLEAALTKFPAGTPNTLMPRWGKSDCQQLLNEYK